uniref:Uncharacterized protein n=1 Tax=Melopsittacus undulatus TaxID=13146 RepID=A0A8C6J643_MELUD
MKSVAALLLVGMLILWTELPAGRRCSAWSCPPVRFRCLVQNPFNECRSNRQCPRYKKCCPTFCECVQPEGPAQCKSRARHCHMCCRGRASPSLY